jgi:hypothetical protein
VENKTLKQTSKQTLKDEDLYLCEMTWNKKLSRIWYITLKFQIGFHKHTNNASPRQEHSLQQELT